MTKKEREALAQFMRLVIYQIHPNISEYGIETMRQAEYSKGDGFEGTIYQDNEYLQQAYYMVQCLEKISQRKENL